MKLLSSIAIALVLTGLPLARARAQAVASKPPSKVASMLEQMAESCQRAASEGSADLSALSNPLVGVSAAGALEMLIHAAEPIGADRVAELEARGARVVSQLLRVPGLDLPEPGVVVAWVPFAQMRAVEALAWVSAMTVPGVGALDAGAIESEGVDAQGALEAQLEGITGAGIAVGVVSNGVTSLIAAQERGELPGVQVLARGSGDEGTAMLEIVHDMAPGADLLFHATGRGPVDHRNALVRLMQAGANVITEDVAFDSEPVFQQGMLAATGDALAAMGVSIHSSGGNSGNTHAARVTALGTGSGPDGQPGPFADCGGEPPTNTIPIAPGGDTSFDVVLGQRTSVILQWSEPRAIFPTAGQGGFTDLDLFLMDATGTRCLARSTGPQAGGKGDPIEALVAPAGTDGMRAKIVVNLFGSFGAARPPVLDLKWRGTRMQVDRPTREGSLNPDSNYVGMATSSGALRAPLTGTGDAFLESFSSAGPIQLGLTTLGDGSRGPGPTAQVVIAPTFVSVDGVSITGVGGFGSRAGGSTGGCPAAATGGCRFFGTSAAAPHSAGCTALVLQSTGRNAPVSEVNRRLRLGSLDDLIHPGPDSVLGFGHLDCRPARTNR